MPKNGSDMLLAVLTGLLSQQGYHRFNYADYLTILCRYYSISSHFALC